MAYQININKRAIKSLEKIPDPYYSHLKKAIIDLSINPRPQGYIKLKGRDGFRIRVGNYRIIYEIFDEVLIIEVIEIGHRREIYDL